MGSAAAGDTPAGHAPEAGAADGEDTAGVAVGAGARELDLVLALLQVLSQPRPGRPTTHMRGTLTGTMAMVPMLTAVGLMPTLGRPFMSAVLCGARGASGIAAGGGSPSRGASIAVM